MQAVPPYPIRYALDQSTHSVVAVKLTLAKLRKHMWVSAVQDDPKVGFRRRDVELAHQLHQESLDPHDILFLHAAGPVNDHGDVYLLVLADRGG